MTSHAIQAKLTVNYPGFNLAVDLQLPGQGITVFYGASGSGKTTCLRALAGLNRLAGYLAMNGEVWQDDARNIFIPPYQRAIGYVFQEASLFPHLSIRENLEFGLRRTQLTSDAISFQHIIELLGVPHLLDRFPDNLSGGEKQRVAIARAILSHPRILLMDEPLAGLDLRRKQEILPYLERLHQDLAIPIIYVTHSPDELTRLADHVVLFEQGRVRASNALNQILTQLDLPIQLGDDAGVVVQGTIAEIDPTWHLARLEFSGGNLWVRDKNLAVGQSVRVRILSRDISITLQEHTDTSILNILPARIEQITEDAHPASVLLRLNSNGMAFVARITRQSASKLALQQGNEVWMQIKAVALLE